MPLEVRFLLRELHLVYSGHGVSGLVSLYDFSFRSFCPHDTI